MKTDEKTDEFWCIIMAITAFAVGMAQNMYEGVGNALCAGTTMTFVAFGIVDVIDRILDKIDSKRNKMLWLIMACGLGAIVLLAIMKTNILGMIIGK